MKFRFINLLFIFIGIAVGIILALQIRAEPIGGVSSPWTQLETQKSLLATFSLEQDELNTRLTEIEKKLTEANRIIENRSSRETQKTLSRLKELTGFNSIDGMGVRITLEDNANVSRLNFSSGSEYFVQASDLRDLVNALFLQNAKAIAINGKRVMPLTPIQPVFDSMLIGNFQIGSPFVITAIGNTTALKEAVKSIQQRKIQIFVDTSVELKIDPLDSIRPLKYLSETSL